MVRWLLIGLVVGGLTLAGIPAFDSALLRLTVFIVSLCLALWISEAAPPFVPTLVLCALTPLLLGPLDQKYALPNVLAWLMDPVLALFFGGFVLGVAAEKYGFDRRLAVFLIRAAGGSVMKMLLLVMLLTAFLSMWMSNIAAAVLMLACLRPVLSGFATDAVERRVVLVGAALGANIGGISTPVGTGPNAIAIASISSTMPISFLDWMGFALPLALGMLAAGFAILWLRARIREGMNPGEVDPLQTAALDDDLQRSFQTPEYIYLAIFAATIVLWLAEPFHGVAAAIVSLGAAGALFLSGVLKREDLFRVDWVTLVLIAGGIALGTLLERSQLVTVMAGNIAWHELNSTAVLFMLCLTSATMAALMSNTAAVVMLIPLAQTIVPGPSTSILIAVAASFGMPFVISTPPNAMAFGEGGVRFGDMFVPGIVVMLLGCLLVSLTGPTVLQFTGVP